jgi:large subunit ribosomal protein L17
MANMLKELIYHGRIQTTYTKAKVLRPHAEKMITLAKENTLASRRKAIAEMMIRFNKLTPKEARAVREENDTSSYNVDRNVIPRLFDVLGPRFIDRQGGYTRIIKNSVQRRGDNAITCYIEFLGEQKGEDSSEES